MYGKLINGELQIAPKRLIINDTQVWNASADDYLSRGWLPVTFTEPPEAPSGYHYDDEWELQVDKIIQTWHLEEDDLDDHELLDILLGGEE